MMRNGKLRAVLGCAIGALGMLAACGPDSRPIRVINAEPTVVTAEPTVEAVMDPAVWLEQAARDDLTAVALAKLAVDGATDPKVRSLALTVLQDHARMAAEIERLSVWEALPLHQDVASALQSVADATRHEEAVARGTKPWGRPAPITVEVAEAHPRVFERAPAVPARTFTPAMATPFDDVSVSAIFPRLDARQRERVDELRRTERGPAFDAAFIAALIDDHEEVIRRYDDAECRMDHEKVQRFAQGHLPMLRDHLSMAQCLAMSGE